MDHAYEYTPAGVSRLKREIMFFDSLILIGGESQVRYWRNTRMFSDPDLAGQFADELEYLLSTPLFENRNLTNIAEMEREFPPEVRDQLSPIVAGDIVSMDNIWQFVCRLTAIVQSRVRSVQVVTCREFPNLYSMSHARADSGTVLSLAIKRVPMPSELTPWQDIFDLKADAEFAHRSRKLSRACEEIARAQLTPLQADEYLGEMLFEYETFMAALKIKTQMTTLQAISVGTAEFIEDILKLRLGKLVGRFASFRVRQAELTMAEMQAPGHALSLVAVAREKFGKPV